MDTQSPLRVLVVDDEPLICWSLAETLGDNGDFVTEAGTGAAAVRAISEAPDPIDVILLDYRLPDVQNLSLLSTVRRLAPDSRVILMSANLSPEVVDGALALGAARVVNKPIDMQEVPALVHCTVGYTEPLPSPSPTNHDETPVCSPPGSGHAVGRRSPGRPAQ